MNAMVVIDHLLPARECVLHRKLVLSLVLLMQVSGCEESI